MSGKHKVVTTLKKYKKHPAVRSWICNTKKEAEYFAATIARRWHGKKIKIEVLPIA